MVKNAVLTENREGSVLRVDVTPNAKSTEIAGVNEWRGALQIRVAAPAKEGAANAELVKFLASRLGVPSANVKILRGHTSGQKSIQLPIPVEEVRKLLGLK